jgi:hypothetical protein
VSVNFGQLKTNVGTKVGDTSTAFATIIGSYINQRYKDVLRRTNWNAINPDYTITATSASTVASASTYKLPSDFGKELYVWNVGTTEDVPYLSLEKLEQEYKDYVDAVGQVEHYSIYQTTDTTAASAEASAARCKKIRFWRAPSTDSYFRIPYIMRPADLSGSTDELVIECETAVEYGAIADAWTYKRQFAKAQYYEALYEKAIQSLIWDMANEPNQIPLMNVCPLSRDEGID